MTSEMFSGTIMLIPESLKFDETAKVLSKMRNGAKALKYSTLETLFTEVLFRDNDNVQNDTLKSFLKFKLDLEEYEANKFLSHLKKVNPSASNQITMKQILSAIKQEGGVESINPFENNIFSEFSRKKSVDFDINKVSDWIFKVSKMIENNNINLSSRLHELDYDSDGYIYSDDLRLIFLKMKLNLNTNDIESMINYFGYSADEKIPIDHFTKNFLGHLNEEK